jgi:multiple sugar transport system substrate-binding protein
MTIDRRDFVRGGIAAMVVGVVPSAERAAAQSTPGLAKYRGQTVRFLTVRNVHQIALADTMGEIAKSWGVDLQTRFITTDQLQKKVVVDFTGGADTWDLVYCGGIQRM